jgi:hypothetical protein
MLTGDHGTIFGIVAPRVSTAGAFFPSPEGMLPVHLKRDSFERLSAEIARQTARSRGRRRRSSVRSRVVAEDAS